MMAHAIFAAEAARRGLQVGVASAGVMDCAGVPPADAAWITCLQHQTPIPKSTSTYVRDLDLSGTTRIFVMERCHISAVLSDFPVPASRVALLGEFDPQRRGAEIDDPFGQGIVDFERCYARLRDCITHYLETTDDFD